MFKYIKIAFRNIIANKKRSLFIGTAVALGTIIMLITASLSEGIRHNMIQNSFALFTGYINVYGRDRVRGEDIRRIPDANDIDNIINEVIHDAKILHRTVTGGKIFNPENSVPFQRTQMLGMEIENEFMFTDSVTTIEGDIYSIKEENVVMIEYDTHRRFDFNIGDILSFEGKVEHEQYGIVNKTENFRIGAIIQGMSMGEFSSLIRVSNETLRNFAIMNENETSQMAIYTNDKFDSIKYANALEDTFRERGYEVRESSRNRVSTTADVRGSEVDDQFDESYQLIEDQDGLRLNVRTWQEEIQFLEEMIRTIEAVALVLNIILMSIILMGISNTLIMSIRERTGEIGTLRAIGMQKPSVIILFVLEGVILGIIGSIIGIIIGGGISLFFTLRGIYIGPSPISIFLVNNILYLRITISLVLTVISTIVVVSGIASLYPSFKAAQLKPITAMQKD